MIRSLSLSAGALALALVVLAASSGTTSAQQSIAVGDLFFCDGSFTNGVCTTTVTAGDTVTWDFGGASLPHTTTDCGADCDAPSGSPLWDSGIVDDGSPFSFTFSAASTYLYRCNVHPDQMRGQIVVEAAQQPEPTAPADGDPAPTQVPGVSVPPTTGFGPGEGSSSNGWLLALVATGGALVLIGAASFRLARR